jgi:hypothetical protein
MPQESSLSRVVQVCVRWAPVPLKLGIHRRLSVTVQLHNSGPRLVSLEFPSTQRIEVLLRDADRRLVEKWSEDRAFEPERVWVALNPGERLEYSVELSTRELLEGQEYQVEAFLPQHPELRASARIVPAQ